MSWIQWSNRNIPKIFQIAPRLMSKFCWKFHENTFIRFPVMLPTGSDFLETEKETLHTPFYAAFSLYMPDLSWQFHENPFIRFPAMLLTDRQTYKQTCRGENTTFAARRRYQIYASLNLVVIAADRQWIVACLGPKHVWVCTSVRYGNDHGAWFDHITRNFDWMHAGNSVHINVDFELLFHFQKMP